MSHAGKSTIAHRVLRKTCVPSSKGAEPKMLAESVLRAKRSTQSHPRNPDCESNANAFTIQRGVILACALQWVASVAS